MACRTGIRAAILLALASLHARSAAAQGDAEQWSFSASTRVAYNTNVLFVPEGAADTVGAIVLRLGYARLRQGSRLTVGGWLIGNKFAEFRSFDGVRGGLDVSGSFPLSPVSRLRFSESVSTGFNPERLYGTGEILPQIQVFTSYTSLGVDYSLTRSTRLDGSLDLTWFRYDSDIPVLSPQLGADTFPEQAAGPELAPGTASPFGLNLDPLLYSVSLAAAEGFLASRFDFFTYHAGAGLSHDFSDRTEGHVQLGYRGTRYSDDPNAPSVGAGVIDAGFTLRRSLDTTAGLSASYIYQRSLYEPGVDTHTVAGRFDKEVTGKWKVDASLGVSFYDGGAEQDAGWSLVGGVGASRRWKRGGFSLHYEHTLYQALGFGRVLGTDFLYAAGSVVPWKRTTLGAYAGLRNTGDLFVGPYVFDEVFSGVYASYHPWKRTGLTLDYSYRRYRFGALPPAGANVIGLSVTYARNWK
jgi:hypothetical protein